MNDLYVFSTRNFSMASLQTSGVKPSPRYGHGAALTSAGLLIWGGISSFDEGRGQGQGQDDSLYLLNLGTS